MGVIQVQRDHLDRAYLEQAARVRGTVKFKRFLSTNYTNEHEQRKNLLVFIDFVAINRTIIFILEF